MQGNAYLSIYAEDDEESDPEDDEESGALSLSDSDDDDDDDDEKVDGCRIVRQAMSVALKACLTGDTALCVAKVTARAAKVAARTAKVAARAADRANITASDALKLAITAAENTYETEVGRIDGGKLKRRRKFCAHYTPDVTPPIDSDEDPPLHEPGQAPADPDIQAPADPGIQAPVAPYISVMGQNYEILSAAPPKTITGV